MIRMRTVFLGIPILLMMSSVVSAGNFTISYRNGNELRVKEYQDSGQSIIFWRYSVRVEVPKAMIAQIRDNESGALKIFAKPYTTTELKELRKRQAEALERLPGYKLPIIQANLEHQKELELKRQQLEEQRRQEELRVSEVLQKRRELKLREQQLQEQRQHQQRLEASERQRLNESRRGTDTIERRVYIQEPQFQPTQQQKQYTEPYYTDNQKQLLEQKNEALQFMRNLRQKAIQKQQKDIQKYKKYTVQQCKDRILGTCAARGISRSPLCKSLQKQSCGP